MAETNEYIAESAQTMYVLSSDKRIIEQCRRRKVVEHTIDNTFLNVNLTSHKYITSTYRK
jgi:hypothetical protein